MEQSISSVVATIKTIFTFSNHLRYSFHSSLFKGLAPFLPVLLKSILQNDAHSCSVNSLPPSIIYLVTVKSFFLGKKIRSSYFTLYTFSILTIVGTSGYEMPLS